MNSIDGDIAEARLGTTNLDVFALALVALERDAWQPPNGVGDVRVRQTGDDTGWKDLENVVSDSFAV